MDEHDDFVNMSRVFDFSKNGSVFHGDNLGFGENDGDEIMVEIVGSDVFVDGVGGNDMSGNDGDLKEMGDLELQFGGFENNTGGDGDFVDVVEEEVDVLEEVVDVVMNDNVVKDYGVSKDVKFWWNGDDLERPDEVTGSGDMCCGNVDGLERRDEVTGSGGMCCVLTNPSAHECSGMRDEALSCESEVSAGNCTVATGLSIGETVVEEKMTCCFNKDNMKRMVENFVSQIGMFGDEALNAETDSGLSSSAIGKTEDILEQVSVEVKERGLNCKDQVLHNDIVDTESPCLETVQSTAVERICVESDTGTTCVNTESVDCRFEAVVGVNEMLNNKEETSHSGPKFVESDVYNGNLQCSAGEGLMNNNMVTQSSGDHVKVSVDFVSSQKPAKLVVDSQVADDDDKVYLNKGIETSKGVNMSEGKWDYGEGTQTFPDLVSTIEHTQVVAGCNEVIYNEIITVNDIEMTTNDSFLPNPMSEVSVIKAVQCETKYADAIKDSEPVLISEIEVSEMNFKEAIKYKGSEADAPRVGLSVCGGEESSGEATLMRTEVLDLKEAPTSVQHMKAVESLRNDVAHEQHDMVILSEGIVKASVVKIFDENIDSNSKTRVLDGDTKLVEHKNMSGLDLRGSVAVNEAQKDDIQNPDVKRSGLLGCEDDESKILNQPLTDAILNKGDSHPAIPHIIGEVTCAPEAVLSSNLLHRESEAVQYLINDFPSHLPDCNRNSIVTVMSIDRCLCPEDEVKGRYASDGVSSDELVPLTFERRDNKPVMCSLVDNIGTFCNEEEKNLEGAHLDGNVSLSHDINCVDSNVQGTERNIDLQYSECLDASSTDNHTGVSSDQDHILEVEEIYNEDQVDVHTDQEMEIQDETINFQKSEIIDEKIAEQVSPSSARSITEFHSRYLLSPNKEGEFSVSDLVWSKNRSHPWWPGQIFNPADASEKAMKHHKNDRFLIAYFGDRTVAWNDTSRIRPFKSHFSEIEGQRSSEAFHHAVSRALVEVSRRVQLGLACSCIPKNSFAEIESQIVENIGIRQEAGRRFGMDESTAASCFEPEELLEHVRSLALISCAGADGRLQLTISKAQLAAFSRFKGHHPLPEFHSCDGLLENDANTSRLSDVIQEHSEPVKGENNRSSKRKRDSADSLPPRKKKRSMPELIGDMLQSDGEEELDSVIWDTSVTSSTRKRKTLNSVTDGSGRRQIYYAAKVSTTASQTPKQSFKVGKCILRVASQLTGSPSLLNCNSEKFLETDDSVDQHPGFDYFHQTPLSSQQGMMLPPKYSSIDEMLSQLYLAAQDPTEGYNFLNEITTFFSGFRQLVAAGQNFRRWNQSTGEGGRMEKAPHSVINSTEDFEFDDVNDSYWTDRIVQKYDEKQLLDKSQNAEAENQQVPYEADKEQILDRAQNGEAENQLVPCEAEADIEQILDRAQNGEAENQLVPCEAEADKEQILDRAQNGEAENQLVPCEADKPVRSDRRSRKRFSSGKHVMVAEEPVVEHMDSRRPDCSPTELILKFTEGKSVPSELNLNKLFRRFGSLREPETEVDRETSRAKVVYKRCSDAKVALSSAGIFNIFGPTLVSYELSYVPSAPFKTLPAATVQDQEDAS